MMRIAVLQMRSGTESAANLDVIERAAKEAAEQGAAALFLPETCTYRGPFHPDFVETMDGPSLERLRTAASATGMSVLVGGIWLDSPDPGRAYNCAVVIDDTGAATATYRKVHLFEYHGPPDGVGSDDPANEIVEADETVAGDQLVTAPLGDFTLGLSICFDLRFPELYRALVGGGADLLCVPSNFSSSTGRHHWEPLLRARAIENLAYVVAPAQFGSDATGFEAFGHSMVIDPWGRTVASAGSSQELLIADLEPAAVDRARSSMPSFDLRRPDVYSAKPRQGGLDD